MKGNKTMKTRSQLILREFAAFILRKDGKYNPKKKDNCSLHYERQFQFE